MIRTAPEAADGETPGAGDTPRAAAPGVKVLPGDLALLPGDGEPAAPAAGEAPAEGDARLSAASIEATAAAEGLTFAGDPVVGETDAAGDDEAEPAGDVVSAANAAATRAAEGLLEGGEGLADPDLPVVRPFVPVPVAMHALLQHCAMQQ